MRVARQEEESSNIAYPSDPFRMLELIYYHT